MALKRVTLQDIAKTCGFSRNTVSKVFNNRGNVPEATKRLILQKARELGYFQLPENEPVSHEEPKGNIALITNGHSLSHAFGIAFLRGFTNQASRLGYNLKIYELSGEELEKRSLPPHLSLQDVSGIICIELFDRDYLTMLASLGLPLIFVDNYAQGFMSFIQSDIISMENFSSTVALTEHLIAAGAKRIGFVGDIRHCLSFKERWKGYLTALQQNGLVPSEECSIFDEDCDDYGDPKWMLSHLDEMPGIPDAFVCANDFIAISLMAALKKKGLLIPKDVMVTGFDGSPEASVVDPALTTVQIPGADIGRITADILLNQIKNPGRPYLRVYVKTVPVFRDSTR